MPGHSDAVWVECLPRVARRFNEQHCGQGRVLRDAKGLEAACARPFISYSGVYLYDTVVEKAVALLEGIAQHHPFDDGNKRTAWAVTIAFLKQSGFTIDRDNFGATDVEALVVGLITKEVSFGEAVARLGAVLCVLVSD